VHWLGNVLEFFVPEIADGYIRSRSNLKVGMFRKANRTGFADIFEARGDVDAIAHEIAVRFLDHVAEVNANAEQNLPFQREPGIALNHAVLHFNRTTDGVHNAAKLDQNAIAATFDDTAVMDGDRRINKISTETTKARYGALFIGSGKTAKTGDIRREYRREFAGFAHPDAGPPRTDTSYHCPAFGEIQPLLNYVKAFQQLRACGYGQAIRQLKLTARAHPVKSRPTTNDQRRVKPPLPAKLRSAFARYKQDPNRPLPRYPRAVRLGIDYTLRITIDSIETEDQADIFAWHARVLAELQKNDPPGDPPATCAAFDAAESAGPRYRRAFLLLGIIRDCSNQWRAAGRPVPALSEATMRLLQQAARAEPVEAAELTEVLEAAQQLADRFNLQPPRA
jgi:hypothetical protein